MTDANLSLLHRIRHEGHGLVHDDGDLLRIGGRGHTGADADTLRMQVHDLTRLGLLAAAGPRQLRLTERALDCLEAAPDFGP